MASSRNVGGSVAAKPESRIKHAALLAQMLKGGRLKHEEARAEIGNLKDDRIAGEIEHAEAVDQILARTGDVALAGILRAGKHAEPVDRCHGRDAAYQEGLGLDPVLRPIAVVDVHQRPRPEIGEARDLAHEIFGQFRAGHRAARHRPRPMRLSDGLGSARGGAPQSQAFQQRGEGHRLAARQSSLTLPVAMS